LPPLGKFARLALALALLLALLLALNIAFVHDSSQGLLFANSLTTALALLTAVCCFHAARQVSGYLRQQWLLLSVAVSLETVAMLISTYFSSFVPGAHRTPWPYDLLFFVWAAPVLMIFLPPADTKSPGPDWLRIFDFAQIAILAITAYLYFSLSPPQPHSQDLSVVQQFVTFYLLRDTLLVAAFLFRWRQNFPAPIRQFALAMACVFFASAFSNGFYLSSLQGHWHLSSWGDLLWLLPFCVTILFAATWNPPAHLSISPRDFRISDLAVTHVLPLAIPLLVMFLGRSISGQQFLLAWLAVAASFLCSFIRLLLTNRKQRFISEQLLVTQLALSRSEALFSSAFRASPDSFSINLFPKGPYVDVNEGFTRLTGYSREEAIHKTPVDLNLWLDHDLRATILQRLTTHGEVKNVEFSFRTKSHQVRFGQLSSSLIELDGHPCALVAVRDITEHKAAEDALRESEERFRTLVRDLHAAVVLHGPDRTLQFANQAALDMFGLSPEQALGKHVKDLGLLPVDESGLPLSLDALPVPTVIRTGLPVRNLIYGWRRPDHPDILWISSNTSPQFAPDGSLLRVISSFVDISEMKNAERAIHKLSTDLLTLQDEERRRIGRELHDGMAQTVLAINLNLAQVRQSSAALSDPANAALDRARLLLHQMSREIRTLSYLLHPPLLDDLGLVSALKEYVGGFTERSTIETTLDSPTNFPRLPQTVETALFRITQESLSNVQRHSAAKCATVVLRLAPSSILLEITDFGTGMNLARNGPSHKPRPRLGVGILGMRERMIQLGGTLDLNSSEGGTTVRATIPLDSPVLKPLQQPLQKPDQKPLQTEVPLDATSHSDRG